MKLNEGDIVIKIQNNSDGGWIREPYPITKVTKKYAISAWGDENQYRLKFDRVIGKTGEATLIGIKSAYKKNYMYNQYYISTSDYVKQIKLMTTN